MEEFTLVKVPFAVVQLVRALDSTGITKIPIIKAVREAYNLGLKQAKFLTDDILDNNTRFSDKKNNYYILCS